MFDLWMLTEILYHLGVFAVLFVPAIVLHEYAHAWVSFRLGDSTPKVDGRLTLNPLAHLDIWGTVIVPLLLSISGLGVLWWAKPVRIDPRNYADPRQWELLVALAGPLMNIVLGVLSIILLVIWIGLGRWEWSSFAINGFSVVSFVAYFALINFGLALFNMLPLPPLDGFRLVSFFFPQVERWVRQYSMIITIMFALVIIWPGSHLIGTIIMSWSQWLFGFFYGLIGQLLF